ncbi:alpha/beta hydrolase [Nostoc sp. FACHB-152]|uniref:alpha/beta hydrolase n=1 Tax=unclassified Nostoc TaxID=2593658 RepID=UPI0016853AE7|nr:MULTISPECIES: alpha/beta hydrolase [unclassified Nostoc]MBD2447449.1 alpha/beta hydrolase [Nostoc sp. FACHB-152]MBD2468259.1 alpha/beta hydrolase [Nostoc sp. FACHB-145]
MNSLFGNWASTLKKNSLLLVPSLLLPIFGINTSVKAAERVYVSYSALELSISVAALENYAKKGVVDHELAIYQQYLSPKQFQELQRILITPVKSSPVIVGQFLSTPQGESLLRRFAEVIQSKSPQMQPELDNMRSALVLALAEPEGLNLLNLLRKYPANNIRIDLGRSFAIAGELEDIVKATNEAIAKVTQRSNLEAVTIPKPSNLSQLADLQKPGSFKSNKYTLNFFDYTRNRLLLTDIYIPNVFRPTSVIVISHGLGTDSSNFQYLATHLASYGFAVVVPNHPAGDTKELFTANEFTDRPLDIKYMLNQLEKDLRFKSRLNLQQVGIFGQSFGGYTALALAGAKINFEQLAQDCQSATLHQTWNMSLLFQCRALELKNRANINLQDTRVKAAIAVSPVTSSIFGKAGLSQIQTPVMIFASSNDTVAPALNEQIIPFSWLANSQKYLITLVGGTHFSTIGDSNSASGQIQLPSDVVGDASQARRYINTFSLPFFQTYIAKKPQYISYLHPAYAQKISSPSLGLNLVQSLSTVEISSQFHKAPVSQAEWPYAIVYFGFWLLNKGQDLLMGNGQSNHRGAEDTEK